MKPELAEGPFDRPCRACGGSLEYDIDAFAEVHMTGGVLCGDAEVDARHREGALIRPVQEVADRVAFVAACENGRPHGGHVWFMTVQEPAVGVTLAGRRCEGLPAVVASFADYVEVKTVRCYYPQGSGVCRALLVYDTGAVGFADLGGWTMSEWQGSGHGERSWACPRHAGQRREPGRVGS